MVVIFCLASFLRVRVLCFRDTGFWGSSSMRWLLPTCLVFVVSFSACSGLNSDGPVGYGRGSRIGDDRLIVDDNWVEVGSPRSALREKRSMMTRGMMRPTDQETLKDSDTANISFERPPSLGSIARGETKPPEPGELGEKLSEAGEEWFFGPGLGRTALNVGTVIVFPPYGLYLLANAGLQLCGYEGLYVTDALPDDVKAPVLHVYDGVTAVPGQVNAAVFDHRSSRNSKLNSVFARTESVDE